MRRSWLWLGSAAFLVPSAASAADQLKFGKPPEWVVPQAIPADLGKSPDAPASILLGDQQIRFEPGKTTTYSEVAMKLRTPEGLAAGNISLPWDPAADTVTVNKLQIHRGGQIIDVLASGQTFTTMRRETNLDLAMLDGVLTANIQPEGLQQGDVVDLAVTIEHVDPVFGSHVESNFMQWGGPPVQLAHVHLEWPDSLPLKVQTKGFTVTQAEHSGRKAIELTEHDVEPIVPPKGAPARFRITRLGEATDLASWADLAKLTAPLYRKAESIPTSGPLHAEVENIRTATSDPKQRAAKALQLVQDRVRYVALSMGQGGYAPADAATTWSRRFGDCKAKTALLLGILHSLAIEAEPVLVNGTSGDHIAERLPMIGLFNHVLVRAHIGGKVYFLDGTRTGDSSLDAIDVPNFDWGLPLVADAKLVAMVPPPLNRPAVDTKLLIDATSGVRATVGVTVEQILHGDEAVVFNKGLGALADAQRLEFFDNYWKASFDFVTPGPTKAIFDAATRTLSLSMAGTGKLDWNTGYYHVPNSTVGFTPDFDRASVTQRDAPVAVAYPSYSHSVTTIRLPPGFFGSRPAGNTPTTHEILAGVEYSMRSTRESGPAADVLTIETSEHSLVPEVAYRDAVAAEPRLRELADEDAAIPLPRYYHPTKADFAAWLTEKPPSANAYVDRGNALMDARRFDEAIADFNQALVLDTKNVVAFADRALAHWWKNEIPAAELDIAAAKALQADNPVVWRAQAVVAEQKGDYAAAIEAYTASLKIDASNNFAMGHRAICEASLSKNDEALADSATALKADPSWMDLRLLRANIFVRRGSNDQVAKEAELLTSENPRSAYAYVAAGRIYARLARTQDAMRSFDAALAIKADALVYLNRADARPFTDRAGRLADLDMALKLEPNNSDALAEKAEQLAVDGDLKRAKEIYDKVVAADPDARYYKIRRAVMVFKTGAADEARKQFAQLRTDAKSASDLNSLCWAKATGDILLELALDECREAVKRDSEAGAYLDSLALVELRLGHVDEAIADYTRAIAKNTGAASYMGRALAYARKGNQALASADLRQALQLDPDEQTRFAEFGLKLSEAAVAGAAKVPVH